MGGREGGGCRGPALCLWGEGGREDGGGWGHGLRALGTVLLGGVCGRKQ